MLKLLVGFFIGGFVGFGIACILQAEEMDDEDKNF